MDSTLFWLVASALLTLLQWVPYISNRALLWGFGTFLSNYPPGFPASEPEPPLWAQRAKRAHLNMVETFAPFAAVTLVAIHAGLGAEVATAAMIFFAARVAYAVVYIAAIPGLRTPTYLVSWGSVLYMGVVVLG